MLLSLPSVSAAAPATPSAPPQSAPFVLSGVTRNNVNLRSAPSLEGKVLALMPQGSHVSLGECPEWCSVRYTDAAGKTFSGYAASWLIRRVIVPIVTAPSKPVEPPSAAAKPSVKQP